MVERLAPKLLSWASILDEQTRAQAETSAGMPFIHPHLALMPDAHLGKGATVGSVIPTLGAIIPAAVGVDIGCGMVAVRTQLSAEAFADDRGRLRAVHRAGGAAVGRRLQPCADRDGRRYGSRSWSAGPRRRASTRPRTHRTGGSSWALSAPATTSSR